MAYKFEQGWDLPIDKDPENPDQPVLGRFVRVVINAVLGTVFRLAFRANAIGKENVEQFYDKSGAVIICNHASYLDPVFLWIMTMPKKMIRFMGRENLFYHAKGFVGWLATGVGAFPVKRNSADRTALKRAASMLKRNELVGIFAEGTRRGKGSMEIDIFSGAAFVARMGKAPMIPSTVRGVDKIKPKGSKMFRLPKITVVFGKPVYLEEFDFMPKEDRLDAASWFVMRECYAMLYECPNTEVDMPALFPKSRDFTADLAEFTANRA